MPLRGWGWRWVRLLVFRGMHYIITALLIKLHGYTLQILAEAGEEVSSKSHNKINTVEVPLIGAELDKEKDTEKSKASSLRSVTLWVCNESRSCFIFLIFLFGIRSCKHFGF